MGFLFVNSTGVGFTGNLARGNSSFGMLGYEVNDCFLANNVIEENDAVGLILDSSDRNAVQFNTIRNNSGIGAFFSSTTDGNYAVGNQYQGNAFSLGLIDEGDNFIDE